MDIECLKQDLRSNWLLIRCEVGTAYNIWPSSWISKVRLWVHKRSIEKHISEVYVAHYPYLRFSLYASGEGMSLPVLRSVPDPDDH